MFKATISQVGEFKNVMKAIATLIDEATFHIDENGIKLRAMDPSRVAMVDFEWSKSVFDEFTCTEPTKLCINLGELMRLLGRARGGDVLELTIDEETGRLAVVIHDGYRRSFHMPTLEAAEEEIPGELKIPFTVKATLTTKELRQAVDDAKLVSDHISIIADENGLTLKATGDVTSATIEFPKGSEVLSELEVKEESKASFGLAYLSDIVKAASVVSEVVTMEYATDKPIKLDFKLPYEGKLVFYLAPRVEAD